MGYLTRLAAFLAAVLLTGSIYAHATTYIVMENGVEVGKVEKSDGSDEVKTIENIPPQSLESSQGRFETMPPNHDGVPAAYVELPPSRELKPDETAKNFSLDQDWILVSALLILTMLVKYLFDKKSGKGHD